MDTAPNFILWVLIGACVGSGIMAGLFCSFSVFMMKALASLPTASGIMAMQAINRFIVRPSFLLVFFGTGLLCAMASFQVADVSASIRGSILAAAVVYNLGCLGVTVAFNVPLNNRLEAVDAESEEGRVLWQHYLHTWTRWNHLRSVSTILSTCLLVWAIAQM